MNSKPYITLLGIVLCSPLAAQWREGNLPDPRDAGYAAVSDTHMFYCGGLSPFAPVSTVLAFEFTTGTWETHTLAKTRCLPAAVYADDRVFVAGGTFWQNGALMHHDSVEVLDPLTGSVDDLTLPVAVAEADAAAVGDYVFFAGGRNGQPFPGVIQAYHVPTDSWEVISMQTQDRRFMGVAADDRWVAFVGGGFPGTDGPWVLNLFDNTTGVWEVIDMPNPHTNASAVIHEGKLYISGTAPFFGNPDIIDILDLDLHAWSTIPSASQVQNRTAFGFGPYVVFANGFHGGHIDTADIWNTLTNEWKTTQLSIAAQQRVSISSEAAGVAAILGGQDPTIANSTDKIDFFLIDEDLGIRSCSPAEVNSTGLPGTLSGVGAQVAEDNFVTLVARDLPTGPFAFGLFLISNQSGFLPMAFGSQGTLCLGSFAPLHKTLQPVDPSGRIAASPDLSDLPAPFGQAVTAGQSWSFQGWYRDSVPGVGLTSNFTDAIRIDFQ